METWWEILSVFLMSTVKFVFGAVPLALSFGFSFFEAVTITSLGGFTGVTFFVFLSDKIIALYKRRTAHKHLTDPTFVHPRKFTRRSRFIVNVKKKSGLYGVAFLTPLLFSIPLGCFIAVRYFKNRQRILLYMYVAILFWSVSISSFKLFFK